MPPGLDWRWGGKLTQDSSPTLPASPTEPSTPEGSAEESGTVDSPRPEAPVGEAEKAAARRLLLLQLLLVGGSLLFWALRVYLGGDGPH